MFQQVSDDLMSFEIIFNSLGPIEYKQGQSRTHFHPGSFIPQTNLPGWDGCHEYLCMGLCVRVCVRYRERVW